MELIVKKFEKALELSRNGKIELLTDDDRYKIIGKLVCCEMIDDIPNDDELVFMLSKCVSLFHVKPVCDETYNANVRLIDRLQKQLQEMSFKVVDQSVIDEKDEEIKYLESKVNRMTKIINKLIDDEFDVSKDTFENYLVIEDLKKQLTIANEEVNRYKDKLARIKNAF